MLGKRIQIQKSIYCITVYKILICNDSRSVFLLGPRSWLLRVSSKWYGMMKMFYIFIVAVLHHMCQNSSIQLKWWLLSYLNYTPIKVIKNKAKCFIFVRKNLQKLHFWFHDLGEIIKPLFELIDFLLTVYDNTDI